MAYDINHPVNTDFNASNSTTVKNSFLTSNEGIEDGSYFGQGAVDWAVKGVPLAVASGVSQLWNGVGYVGNGISNVGRSDGNKQEFTNTMDMQEVANNFGDSDTYGQYYQDHSGGIDLGGFVLGSLVPSTIAIKGLRVAQKGIAVTESMGSATGLLSNTAERYWLNRAAVTVGAEGGSMTSFRLKAGLAFAGQNTLEGLAASTATYATMSQSPLYENLEDAGDVAKSILVGSLLFGGLAGGYRATIGFQRGLFPLAGSEVTEVAGKFGPQQLRPAQITNLRKFREYSGAEIFEAGYAPVAANMVGMNLSRTLDDPLEVQAIAAKAQAKIDLAEGRAYVPPTATNTVADLDHYVFTQGDQLAAQINGKMKLNAEIAEAAKNTVKLRGAAAEAVEARAASIRATKANEISALESDLYTALAAKGSPDVALPFKGIMDKLVGAGNTAGINQVLNGLSKISRADLKSTNSAARTRVIDLATGEHDGAAIYTLGDLGVVKAVNQKVVLVDGKQIKLGAAMTQDGMKTASPHVVQARYFAEMQHLAKEVKAGTVTEANLKAYKVRDWDVAAMEASIRTFDKFMDSNGVVHVGDAAKKKLLDAKLALKGELEQLDGALAQDIRARLNVSSTFLDDFASGDPAAMKGLMDGIDTTALRHVELTYATESRVPNVWEIKSAAGNEVRIRAYQEYNEQLLPMIMGDLGEKLPNINLANYSGIDDLAGIITSANARLGTEASKMQYAGRLAQEMQLRLATTREAAFMTSHHDLEKFAAGSPQATELSVVRYTQQSAGEKLALAENGGIYKVKDMKIAEEAGDDLSTLVPVMEVQNIEVLNYLKAHVKYEGELLAKKNLARRGVGKASIQRHEGALGSELYFSPPHPEDLLHKVLVFDPSVGNVGMLWAGSKEELAQKVLQVKTANASWEIRTPEQIDSFKKLQDVYDDALSLRGFTAVDVELKNMGVMADLAPSTNLKDMLAGFQRDFARSERNLVTAGMFMKYAQPLAEAYRAARSVGVDNIGLKKVFHTIMNIQDKDNTWHRFSSEMEKQLDQWGGKQIAALRDNLGDLKTGKVSYTQLEAKQFADDNGASLYGNEALWNLSRAREFNGTAQKAVREANSLMRFLVLGVDYFNGLVNMIGTPILALPEIKAAFAAGEDVPWAKILGAGMKDLFKRNSSTGRSADLEYFANIGVINKNMFMYHDLIDSHALVMGSQNSGQAMAASNSLKRKMEKYLNTLQTPTAYAEQTTQLFAAKIAKSIGDARGLTGNDLHAFISTMQQKIIGNYTSAQRPLVFQGVLGQAVGLFQTYNFNLFQQAARHLQDGNNKSIAAMLALQGTIFGAQSLPGFRVMNQAVGAYGGDEETDIYSGVRNLLGESAGNSLVYGNLSTMLGSNLWSRGNTNPRNITVLPATPADLAQVTYYGRAMGAVGQFVNSIAMGGNLKVSGLEAISHANLSRPLTGIAELAMGARTTGRGNLDSVVGTDMLSTATAIRVMGGRPMAEALAQEQTYRFGLVQAKESENLRSLGYAIRTEMIDAKGNIDAEKMAKFSKLYAEKGGHPQGFRRWYLANLKNATTPAAQVFAERHKKEPWAKTYQELAAPDEQAGM